MYMIFKQKLRNVSDFLDKCYLIELIFYKTYDYD